MSGVITFCGRLVSSAARIVSADLTPRVVLRFGREPGGMRRDDQAAFEPRLARAVGAQQFGDRLDRRLDRQHVEPGGGDMAVAQQRAAAHRGR